MLNWHPRHSPVLRHLFVLLLHGHGKHVRPILFSGHSHNPVVTSQILLGPLHLQAKRKTRNGQKLFQFLSLKGSPLFLSLKFKQELKGFGFTNRLIRD